MNKSSAYFLIGLSYVIYFVVKYATRRDRDIYIKAMLEIYYFVATLLLGMTTVI